MEEKNTKVTTVILNYKKANRALENVRFLLMQETDFLNKIIVVDNSCDEKEESILREGLKDKKIDLIINQKNVGYSKGNNLVNEKIQGDYLLTMNSDILLKENNSIQKIVDFMDKNKEVAILGPKQINDDGNIAMSVRAFPKFYLQIARRTFLRNLPFIKKRVFFDEMKHLNYDEIQDVDWLQSSCFIVRRSFWERVGGFNEKYFLFMADTEICWRAWEAGLRVIYYPEVEVYADGKRISAGGFSDIFKNWIIRRHIVDSTKYHLGHFWKDNPRRKYYENNSN